jgi:hypothetical protein
MEEAGSNLNPLALLFLMAMCMVVFRSSREHAVSALLVTAAMIPLGQQLVVFGLHFHFLRILLLAGLCRVLTRQETSGFKMNRMDKLFLAWALVGLTCGFINKPSAEVLGAAYNSLGTYFLIRILMRRPEEVVGHLRVLAVVAAVVAASMCLELVTHRNPFFIFGGVPDELMVRDDRVRCQGPFRIPILAGTFAATLFPLMVGLWFQDPRRKSLAVLGMSGCLIATVLSNSSGPLLSLVAAFGGLALWRLRGRMQLFRRALLAIVVGFALFMKAPVWFLIARVSDLIGGGGWHRSFVIDVAVKHFSEWWLIGTARTADWAEGYQVLLVDPNNMDITNHFVAQGISGGVWMLGLFIAMIVLAHKTVGRFVRGDYDVPLDRKLIWTMGVALSAHCTAFISISYFDQISVFWFWLLAVMGALVSCAENVRIRPGLKQRQQVGGFHESELLPGAPTLFHA